MVKATWLADVLRAAGLKVVEQKGWKTRGRAMNDFKGIILHHTAGSLTGNMPSLNVIQNGRPGLSGPLSHMALGRDGTFYIVAAGKCNHAGHGAWKGNHEGNSTFLGIEAENTGLRNNPWPVMQLDAYVRGVSAIAKKLQLPTYQIIGHKEWANPQGRKIDPSFNMDDFRRKVDNQMGRKKKMDLENPDPVGIQWEPVTEEQAKTAGECESNDLEFNTKLHVTKTEDSLVASDTITITNDDMMQEITMFETEKSLITVAFPESDVFVASMVKTAEANAFKGFDRAKYAKKLLMELGWKDYQAAAMVGNAMTESGKNLDTKAKGDYRKGKGHSSYGIMQWRLSRFENLKKFLSQQGKKLGVDDLEAQVRFIDWELRNTEKTAAKLLRESNNLMAACRAGISYCRPYKWTPNHPENGHGWGERVSNASLLM